MLNWTSFMTCCWKSQLSCATACKMDPRTCRQSIRGVVADSFAALWKASSTLPTCSCWFACETRLAKSLRYLRNTLTLSVTSTEFELPRSVHTYLPALRSMMLPLCGSGCPVPASSNQSKSPTYSKQKRYKVKWLRWQTASYVLILLFVLQQPVKNGTPKSLVDF